LNAAKVIEFTMVGRWRWSNWSVWVEGL